MDTPLALVVFAAGFVAACLALRRFTGLRVQFKIGPPASTGGSPGFSIGATRSVDLAISCPCGAVHRFHAENGMAGAGSSPLPQEDSYTCPKCGKLHDLKKLRELVRKSGVDM